MDGSAEAAGTPPHPGKLGTMRSFIKGAASSAAPVTDSIPVRAIQG